MGLSDEGSASQKRFWMDLPGLPSAPGMTTASDEVNNFDLISVFQCCLLPLAARHHRLVEFDCDFLRRQR